MADSGVISIVVPAWTRRTVLEDQLGVQELLTPADRVLLQSTKVSGRLRIRELRRGLEVETHSFVGILPLDRFTLHIAPRVPAQDLIRMVDYGFEIATLQMLGHQGLVQVTTDVASDLVVCALLCEARHLLALGLLREYVERHEDLTARRGKVQFRELASRPRPAVTLPCRYEERTADIRLNRLLLAGVQAAGEHASSVRLRRMARRMAEQMKQLCSAAPAIADDYREAMDGLTRLSAHYRKALELAWLVNDCVSPDPHKPDSGRFPGFLVDMNLLFERFVRRLLEEFRPRGTALVYQGAMPSPYHTAQGPFPHPLPDFMLLDAAGQCLRIIDSKYKFVDEQGIAPGDLYQLTVYGLATEAGKAIALYPSQGAGDREILFRGRGAGRTTVVFRPLVLEDVWSALDSEDRDAEGRKLVARLLA